MRTVIVVTGGSGGIGAAAAEAMARRDRSFVLQYATSADKAEAAAAKLQARGAEAITAQADMSREQDIVRLFERAASEFGTVTGAIASAGTDHPRMALAELTGEEITRVLALNTAGVLLTCREAVRHMPERGNRAIVVVSSWAATSGGRPGKALYAASKAAVDAFTQGTARELAPRGIRINSVRPGMTETGMIGPATDTPEKTAAAKATIPLGRFATAEEVGETIAFLMSEKAGFITGARVEISGGGIVI